jgi:FKBP-type peptidyl-prolyl cis-trans isomerase FkpA
MKKKFIVILLVCISTITNATVKDSTIVYNLPDSVKAVQFMVEISIPKPYKQMKLHAGIKTDAVTLELAQEKRNKVVKLGIYKGYSVAKGDNVFEWLKNDYLKFPYNWEYNTVYKLLIATAFDSASNFSLHSGYIWLPKENKWKLIGTCRINGKWNTIHNPRFFCSNNKNQKMSSAFAGQVWIQRQNGSWKNLKDETTFPSDINLYSHADSLSQRNIEVKQIGDSIAAGKTDAINKVNDVYYTIMKEGTGRQVSVDDTVTVFYKGYLFSNGTVFDETKEKPATFPLKRLIKGWQIGLPQCKVGGKIKLLIPSNLAYSIRTRAAKIPPNSILVFEIEVLEAKPPF